MRIQTLSLAAVVAAFSFVGTADAACNVRGQFCGYPSWAANAFSHPRERVPNWVLDDQHRRLGAYGHDGRRRHSSTGKTNRWR